jgi:thiamine pyrophosphate-dependent acetolactate synthase large subunit-like protein
MEKDIRDENLDVQAELHHLDEHIRSKLDAYQESDPEKREQIERVAVAIEDAKQRFFLLGGQGIENDDPELLRLIESARQGAHNLDVGENAGGPPLA